MIVRRIWSDRGGDCVVMENMSVENRCEHEEDESKGEMRLLDYWGYGDNILENMWISKVRIKSGW